MLLPSQVRTRVSQAQVAEHISSCKELMKWNQDMLSLTKQACNYLEKQGYVLKDTHGSKMTLVHTMLLLAHYALQGVLQCGRWAVATLLEHETATKVVDDFANVAVRIDPLLNLVEEASDMTKGVITNARRAATCCTAPARMLGTSFTRQLRQ